MATSEEVDALLGRLRERRHDTASGVIRWHMRQVVIMRARKGSGT